MTNDLSAPLCSPLRYPGGKAFLCRYVENLLKLNGLSPDLLVEPFAGGASVGLHLLGLNLVKTLALFDKDPLVASFWRAAFTDSPWLQDKIRKTRVTIRMWEKLRASAPENVRENAWKCLFLNRTSFSGILSPRAGPLGGKAQQSEYGIDCRFYKDTIVQRLQGLWEQRARVVHVENSDWRAAIDWTIRSATRKRNAFVYLDPPFFHKAERLYNHVFDEKGHEAVIRKVADLETPWLLSYDDCDEAIRLFRKHGLKYIRIAVRYTSSASACRNVKKELVASNLALPKGSAI